MNGLSGNFRSIWAKIGHGQKNSQKGQEIGERDASACMEEAPGFRLGPSQEIGVYSR
jgi:hypothetical protein